MISDKIKNTVVLVVSYLYVLLFVYAAVSKLLDYENFKVQLGQSPLLSAYAGFVVWSIPFLELLIALLLTKEKYRSIGLYASLGLMVMFSSYIFLILNYSSYVPCSCGGILENMNWTEHLYFNLVFSFFALVAIAYSSLNKKTASIRSLVVVLGSTVVVVVLFLSSDLILHKHNTFIRKYTPFTVTHEETRNLEFNRFYFAGKSSNQLFLGNHTAPALITEIDIQLNTTQTYHINISDTLYKFRKIELRVQPPYFYLFDGTVPCVFKGNLNDSKAVLISDNAYGFTKAEVLDSTTLVIRTMNESRENLLATLSLKNGEILKFAPEILEKQIDGLFDTDGILQYSEQQQKFIYLYYYRNQYLVTDNNLELILRGNTIDTTTQAKIKIEYLKNRNEKKFSAPPLLVNKISAVHNNLLFVNSLLPGRFDVKKMWDKISVIDVYDINTKTYVISFYINDIDGDKIQDLLVTDTHVYALIGTHIVSYKLGDEIRKNYQK